MRADRRQAPLVKHLHLPRRTIRLRLALLYGGLFFISGAALLALTYGGVARTHGSYSKAIPATAIQPGGVEVAAPEGPGPPGAVKIVDSNQRNVDLRVLAIVSVIALAVTAAISMGLGWLVAGRVLRPLRTITGAAREISATDLHRRLALAGPDDEFKELGDTFDGLLGRLDASFQSQRRFVANASHELRTPLARLKTLAQVALADPNASVESLRSAHERVLASEEQLENLIEALLSLANSERELDRRDPLDLMSLTAEILAHRRGEIEHHGLRLNTALEHAPTEGNRQLIERLVANLTDNAIRHNTAAGAIDVKTSTQSGQAVLTIANSGPLISPQDLERLELPFQRLDTERTSGRGGHGLGLSIVHAIAAAHAATVITRAQPQGGLEVEVRFPVQRLSPDSLTMPNPSLL